MAESINKCDLCGCSLVDNDKCLECGMNSNQRKRFISLISKAKSMDLLLYHKIYPTLVYHISGLRKGKYIDIDLQSLDETEFALDEFIRVEAEEKRMIDNLIQKSKRMGLRFGDDYARSSIWTLKGFIQSQFIERSYKSLDDIDKALDEERIWRENNICDDCKSSKHTHLKIIDTPMFKGLKSKTEIIEAIACKNEVPYGKCVCPRCDILS
jgi:hypothetical protein